VEFFHKKTSFRFMDTRKVWYGLSIILMLVSFVSFYVRGLNFAIDFTGGIAVEANYPKPVDVEAVRKAVVAAGFHEPQVKLLGTTRDVGVELQSTGQTADQVRGVFQDALSKVDPGVRITSLEVVGPQVGDELRTSAIISLAVTLVLIGIYIILRFHTWRLSLGAILAVMHDPILVLGVFSVTQTKFDLPVVAAILAVIGYSLNDTVIVFDRIRENQAKLKDKKIERIIDISINEMLVRTILTSSTVFATTLIMNIFGAGLVKNFAFAMNIGVIVGTYSSIFLAAPIFMWISRKWYSGPAPARRRPALVGPEPTPDAAPEE